jgi:hypothetical protein
MVREWDILVCRAEMMGNINQTFVLFLYHDFVVPFREFIMFKRDHALWAVKKQMRSQQCYTNYCTIYIK